MQVIQPFNQKIPTRWVGYRFGGTSAIAGIVAASATNSVGWQIMSGGNLPPSVNFGIGNLSQSGWSWADFSGNFASDISTVTGWLAFASDYSKYQEELYDNGNPRINTRMPDQSYPSQATQGGTFLAIPMMSLPDKVLQTIFNAQASKWNKGWHPLDPLSYVNGLTKKIGLNLIKELNTTKVSQFYHKGYSQRYGRWHITQNIKGGAYFIHSEIGVGSVFPLGLIAHQAEVHAQWLVQATYGGYQSWVYSPYMYRY